MRPNVGAFLHKGDCMIFEKKWFLYKMNKFAPKGYKFVQTGPDGQIAMFAEQFMGTQDAKGPFVSCFSFDLLDTVYGGLMLRRSAKINQAYTLGDYIYPTEISRAPHFAPDQETADAQDGKYEIYKTVVSQHIGEHGKPLAFFMKKNAVLMQALQDANQPLPEYLAKRMNNYVNKSTWYAISRVFSQMPICDMKYYQNLFREKMNELGIEDKNDTTPVNKIIMERRFNALAGEIERLVYDVLPKQEKSLQRAKEKEQTPEKIQSLQDQVNNTNEKLAELKRTQQEILPEINKQPAREILSDQFWHKGKPTVPTISKNPVMQMIQMALMRRHSVKQK